MNENTEIKNARIASTMLGYEDHGVLTCFLNLEFDEGSCQGFGGYFLDTNAPNNKRVGTAYGMEFIARCLSTVGADKWEKLPGNCVRFSTEDGIIRAIGHITKDKWFCPKTDLANFIAEKLTANGATK